MFGSGFQIDQLERKDRRQRVERWPSPRRLGIDAVDGLDSQQAEELLIVLRRPHLTTDPIAGAQSESADLRLRDVDVIGSRKESLAPQEPETIFDDLQDAVAEDLAVLLRLRAEESHHLFWLRQATKCWNLEIARHLRQFLGGLGLEIGEG